MRASRRYLMFTGEGRPQGGIRDLEAVFQSEADARAAFHRIRTERRSGTTWAQLVALDDRGSFKPLCWFDPDRSSRAVPASGRATRSVVRFSALQGLLQRRTSV